MRHLPTKLLAALTLLTLAVIGEAQSYPPAWSNTATYVAGDQVQLFGNVIRAVKPSTVPGKFVYTNWELWEVRANTTVMVGTGQTFPTLEAAWTYAQNARVAEGAYLHLYISTAHGDYNGENVNGFVLDHESGARVSIIGDNRNNIRLGAPAGFSSNAFIIDSGHSFGTISNVSIGGKGVTNAGSGIFATGNASIADVSGIVVSGFGNGVFADQGASITLENTVALNSANNFSVRASRNANILIKNGWTGSATGAALLLATFGGDITAESCTLSAANGSGALAEEGGIIDVAGSSINHCIVGAYAFDHGWIYALNCALGSNSAWDFQAQDGGQIYSDGSGMTANNIDSGTGSYIY